MATFRAMPLYVQGKTGLKLVKTITQCSVKFMRNGEQQIGFDEVLGESHGVVTSEGSFDTVEPVNPGPDDVDIDDLCLDQVACEIGFLKKGKQYRVPLVAITEAETSSTSKSGVQTGKYSWRGGKPQVIA